MPKPTSRQMTTPITVHSARRGLPIQSSARSSDRSPRRNSLTTPLSCSMLLKITPTTGVARMNGT